MQQPTSISLHHASERKVPIGPPRRWWHGLVTLVPCIALCVPAHGQAPTPEQGRIDPSGKFSPTPSTPAKDVSPPAGADWKKGLEPLVEKTGDTTFRIGLVQCDRAKRTITLPVQVQKRDGQVEYALVTTKGKLHESLLATEASPLHLQLAALLLGLSPQPGQGPDVPVKIDLEWATNGPLRREPLESMVKLTKDTPSAKAGSTLSIGTWMFHGSTLEPSGLAAEREGSIIALISDSFANIFNAREGTNDDNLFTPHADNLPPQGLPLSLIIRPAP